MGPGYVMREWQKIGSIVTWFSVGTAYALMVAFWFGIIYSALPLMGAMKAPPPRVIASQSPDNSQVSKVAPVTRQQKSHSVSLNPQAFIPPVG